MMVLVTSMVVTWWCHGGAGVLGHGQQVAPISKVLDGRGGLIVPVQGGRGVLVAWAGMIMALCGGLGP